MVLHGILWYCNVRMVLHDLSCLQCLPLAAPVSSESSANAITSERGSSLLTALAGAGSGSPTLTVMDLSKMQCTQNNAFHFAMLYISEFLLSLIKSPCNPNDTDFSLHTLPVHFCTAQLLRGRWVLPQIVSWFSTDRWSGVPLRTPAALGYTWLCNVHIMNVFSTGLM